jgi:predicted transcriptional regulator
LIQEAPSPNLDAAQLLCYLAFDPVNRSAKVANITLKIDDEILKKARRLAVRRKTSINAIVRKGIEDFVSGDLSREAAATGLEAFFRQSKARVGAKTWTRDELHER